MQTLILREGGREGGSGEGALIIQFVGAEVDQLGHQDTDDGCKLRMMLTRVSDEACR